MAQGQKDTVEGIFRQACDPQAHAPDGWRVDHAERGKYNEQTHKPDRCHSAAGESYAAGNQRFQTAVDVGVEIFTYLINPFTQPRNL